VNYSKTAIPAIFSRQSLNRKKFTTSNSHRINGSDTQCVHLENQWPITIV